MAQYNSLEKISRTCANYLKKGSKIYAEGKITTDSYEKDGIKRYMTKIVINSMIMLDSKGSSSEMAEETKSNDSSGGNSDDDDLPF